MISRLPFIDADTGKILQDRFAAESLSFDSLSHRNTLLNQKHIGKSVHIIAQKIPGIKLGIGIDFSAESRYNRNKSTKRDEENAVAGHI